MEFHQSPSYNDLLLAYLAWSRVLQGPMRCLVYSALPVLNYDEALLMAQFHVGPDFFFFFLIFSLFPSPPPPPPFFFLLFLFCLGFFLLFGLAFCFVLVLVGIFLFVFSCREVVGFYYCGRLYISLKYFLPPLHGELVV